MQQEVFIDGLPNIVLINKFIDAVPLSFSEVQGEIIAGYQQYLEDGWIKQLKEKYTVRIDNGVLEEIRKSLSNE
jgi:peptidyl-prolyl cis-trans isomerase SurA